MDHRERMEVVLRGEEPDRPPVALWRHFPVDDLRPDSLAEAHLHFQNTFDFDFLKVTPSSAYFIYDWGQEDEWRGHPEGTRAYTKRAIQSPNDWAGLKPLDPYQGSLGDQLKALKHIKGALGPKTPVLETIFNPLSLAKKMAGDEAMLTHLRQDPEAFKQGLEVLAESSRRFIRALVKETGIDGVFFATQHAQASLLTKEEYAQFGQPYDLAVLEEVDSLWLNLLHLHGEDVYFDEVSDYEVQAINWHDREGEPDLKGGLENFKGVVCGGLRQEETMMLGTPEQVRAEAVEAIKATGGKRFVLGTGCVVPVISPYGNLMAARRVVEE